jgi:Flp pilus assembly pilin Flp
MSVMLHQAKRFLLDETGLELSEYALGAGFMAIAIATAFGELGVSVSKAITELISNIEDGN